MRGKGSRTGNSGRSGQSVPDAPSAPHTRELPADLLLETEGGYSPVWGEAATNVYNNMSLKKIPVDEKTADNGWLQLFNTFSIFTLSYLDQETHPIKPAKYL